MRNRLKDLAADFFLEMVLGRKQKCSSRLSQFQGELWSQAGPSKLFLLKGRFCGSVIKQSLESCRSYKKGRLWDSGDPSAEGNSWRGI